MPATSPLRCSHSVMAQRGSSEVVLMDTGAYPSVSNYLNETWTWNGTTWARVGTGTVAALGPLPLRAHFAMCYDGYNVVLFGGKGESETSGIQQDTWAWDGATWTKKAPATVPFGRFKAKLAHVGVAGTDKAVMFGGTNVLNHLQETWLWDGLAKTWTQTNPASTCPPARVDHMFADGPTFCVLFGGKNSVAPMGDTWKFDGAVWTQLTPTTPPPYRAEGALCYDVANSNWVLFGGRGDRDMMGDTWVLNTAGTAWAQRAPVASPSFRVGAQMCYDGQAGAVLLFGGCDQAGNTFNDTWKWTGSNWVQL